jgi:serine/threonine protein kinase
VESLVRRAGPLQPVQAARLAADVADALAVLHAHGVTHGLLKPANLLVGADGRPRLLDLGMGAILADNLAADESMLDTISTATAAVTSFDYAAPETVLDPTCRTPAGDVYSFGCVLHFLLTGSPPFPDGNAVDKMLAHQTQPPPWVQDKNPLVPDALAELADRLMAKPPADRPADLPAVRVALLAAAEDRPPSGTSLPAVATPEPLDPAAPTDPPRPAPPPEAATDREFGLDPVSVALSELRSKLTGSKLLAPRSDGAPDSVSFDIPDRDGNPGLPGLIDTGPPGLFALPSVTPPPKSGPNPLLPAPPAADPISLPPALSTLREPVTRPKPTARPQPVAHTPIPASPVLHLPPDAAPAPSRRVFVPTLPPPAGPTPSGTSRLLLASLARIAGRVLPGLLPVSDEVQVSVFGPRHLEPGKKVRLQVYAHLADAFASVCTLSRALQPDSEVLAVGSVTRKVKRGEQVGLHLSVKGGGLARSLTAFAWQGKPKAEPFELLVPWEAKAGRTPAALTVGVNNVQAGRVPFELTVLPRTG